MADIKQIQFKRSKVPGAKPTVSQLTEGELAINLRDRTIFTKDDLGAIVDLGFAKGGDIDGDVNHKGNYTQTGNYKITGQVNVIGPVKVDGELEARKVTATLGEVVLKSGGSQQDASILITEFDGKERAKLTASAPTETSGAVVLRVQNGTQAGQAPFNFNFFGNGRFDAKFVNAEQGGFTIKTVTPLLEGQEIKLNTKPYGKYDVESLVGYSGTEAGVEKKNFLRKIRPMLSGSILHEIIDASSGTAELTWYNGANAEQKIYGSTSAGDFKIHGSLFVGPASDGGISKLGASSISIGDDNTGIKYAGEDRFQLVAGGQTLIDLNALGTYPIEFKNKTRIFNTSGSSEVIAANNDALLVIDTSKDGNNTGNNGHTYLGYNAGGEYYHYFRGKGQAAFNMGKGVYIGGVLTIDGQASSVNGYKVSGMPGSGSWASQHITEASLFQEIDNTGTSVYVPLIKQRYKQGDSTWSAGTLISDGSFHLHMKSSTDDKNWRFLKNGRTFLPGSVKAGLAILSEDGNITDASAFGPTNNLKSYIDNKISAEGYPIGAPIPWPSATVPDGYVAMEGQAINASVNPILASLYGSVLPDMRGQTIKGLPGSGRSVLSYESDAVKSHNHTGAVASTDLGTKTASTMDYGTKETSVVGNHQHNRGNMNITGVVGNFRSDSGDFYQASGAFSISGNVANRGYTGSNYTNGRYANFNAANTWTGNTSMAGDHKHVVTIGAHQHTVPIGAHSHGLTINATGSAENLVKNIAFKYIVKLG